MELGVEGVAQGIAEEAEAEDGQRDREAREDWDPRRCRSVFLGAACSISPQAGTGSWTPRPR